MCGSRRAVVALVVFALAGSASTYVVRPGDTLSGISSRLGVSVRALTDANAISDPNLVFAGQALSLPGVGDGGGGAGAPAAARAHTVAAGENLSRIAARYGTTIGALVAANDLADAHHLRVGQRLAIPGAELSGLPARLRQSPARLALIPHFQRWSAANGIDPALVMAITWHESGWQNHVVSSAGAVGIGQLLPSTARFISQQLIGVPLDPHVPADNIRMSARYVRFLLRHYGGDINMALAGYFQGAGSIARQGLLPVTREYIRVVRALHERFQAA